MTAQEERYLLLDFCAYANMRQPEGGDTPAFRRRIVEGFLATRRPGFAGFSDEELKGVARDAEEPVGSGLWDVLVRGEVLSREGLVQLGVNVPAGVEFETTQQLASPAASRLAGILRAANVEHEVRERRVAHGDAPAGAGG